MAVQEKGSVSLTWGGIQIKGLAEGSASYDLGELGDTLSASDSVVHLYRNGASVVSSITVNVVKGTNGLNDLILLAQSKTPLPMTISDKGMGFNGFIPSANMTQITIGDSSGANDVETYSFIFKGNLNILSLEK